MKTTEIEYEIDGRVHRGFLADGSDGRKVPGVLVCHDGGGIGDNMRDNATAIAKLGYISFIPDIFAEPMRDLDHITATIGNLVGDLPLFRRRVLAGLDVLTSQTQVDHDRLAAVGFCFGGATALELARSGAPLRCVVGFHCLLATSAPEDAKNIQAKVAIHVGVDDPIVPSEARAAFEREMINGDVDWSLHVYGRTGHSFSDPDVGSLNLEGFAYNEAVYRRSWAAMLHLFDESLV